MTCFHPLHGFRGPGGTFVTTRAKSPTQAPMVIPCQKCQGCRLDRSRDWSVRIQHEATLYEENCFLTLTYSNEKLPADGNLSKRDLQLFMKRLRKWLSPAKVRFFACGEYGDRTNRPHYHVILFGYEFPDKVLHKMRNGLPVWRSASLEKLWTAGMSEFGSVTAQSGGYVARYTLKKSGNNHDNRYDRINDDGEVWTVHPEFMLCSTVPMIGYGWLMKYKDDCFPSDFLLLNGKKVPVPKAYLRKLNEQEAYRKRQGRRKFGERHDKEKIARLKHERTEERLAVREEVQALKMKQLNRNCEDD